MTSLMDVISGGKARPLQVVVMNVPSSGVGGEKRDEGREGKGCFLLRGRGWYNLAECQ